MLILVIHARDYIQYRGQERGGFMRAMVCIIVVPDSDCCIYILSVCQMASVLSIQFDMVPLVCSWIYESNGPRDSALVCSWIYESNGMHHGCPRIRMTYMHHGCPTHLHFDSDPNLPLSLEKYDLSMESKDPRSK